MLTPNHCRRYMLTMVIRKRGRPPNPIPSVSLSFRLPRPVKSALQRAADRRGVTLTDYAISGLMRMAKREEGLKRAK